jgi:hypothetical protein
LIQKKLKQGQFINDLFMEKVGTIEKNDTMFDATNYFKGSMVIMS